MKATGIIRRIDDLGRVVIPKEIRRTMHINENDPLEIYVDGKFVMFKKYNPEIIVSEIVKELREAATDSNKLINNHDLLEKIKEIEEILAKSEQENAEG